MSVLSATKAEVKYVLGLEGVKRVLHTAWQVGGGVLVQRLLVAHGAADVKSAVVVAVAAALAAVKALVVARS